MLANKLLVQMDMQQADYTADCVAQHFTTWTTLILIWVHSVWLDQETRKLIIKDY